MDKMRKYKDGNMKILGKKAILMTITALLISILFFMIYSKENILPSFYTNQPVNTRVKAMDNFVKTVPAILGDSLEIATYDALNSLYVMQVSSGTFFDNETHFKGILENCIICGAVSCSGPSMPCTGMNNTHLDAVTFNLRSLAGQHMNIASSFTIYDVTITQNYPYDVDVTLDVQYTISDSNFATWRKRENISRVVSIIGLHDPLTGIATNKATERIIVRSRICEFNESCWNLNSTAAFYNENSFTYAVNGTSFLSRYWNSTNSSYCCGIETFVKPAGAMNVSLLDHYYFSGQHGCPPDIILKYDNIAINFTLDSKTAGRYGISDNGTMVCRPEWT